MADTISAYTAVQRAVYTLNTGSHAEYALMPDGTWVTAFNPADRAAIGWERVSGAIREISGPITDAISPQVWIATHAAAIPPMAVSPGEDNFHISTTTPAIDTAAITAWIQGHPELAIAGAVVALVVLGGGLGSSGRRRSFF